MRFSLPTMLQKLIFVGLLGLLMAGGARAQADAGGAPEQFVLEVANEALHALQKDGQLANHDLQRINAVVDAYILPYVNFQKTTRLAAGRHWRQASDAQKTALAEAFRGTLIRTYSGALARASQNTTIKVLPFRGDAADNDVVVRSLISQPNSQPVQVDYRLEKTEKGWKIYDVNVEGIWLIENYRNQFTQEINQNGIDGLIQALNQRNQ